MKIAMLSEHASPLAAVGDVDAGGQNVHVGALATALAERGHQVDVFTRRDDPDAPNCVRLARGVLVRHLPAGPPEPIPTNELPPYLPEMTSALEVALRRGAYDVLHAHFWMSGQVSLDAARSLDIPVLQTFYALGVAKKRHQGAEDTSPPQRLDTVAEEGAAFAVRTAEGAAEVQHRQGAILFQRDAQQHGEQRERVLHAVEQH